MKGPEHVDQTIVNHHVFASPVSRMRARFHCWRWLSAARALSRTSYAICDASSALMLRGDAAG